MKVKIFRRSLILVLVLVLVISIGLTYAENQKSHVSVQLQDSFAGLSSLELKTSVETITVLYDPKKTIVINKEEQNGDIKVIRAIKTKITPNIQEYYVIDFDEGPSNDPRFVIYKEKGKELQHINSLSGTILIIPGDGKLYSAGHTNNMFDQRKKFTLKKEKIVEVIQPFYYVGLETKVKQQLNIYSTPQQQEVIAVLPKGSRVTVLLNKGEQYLLKTPFGLVGWIRIQDGSQETPIEDLYFAGD